MKVYVVSDRLNGGRQYIRGVFLNREKAEQYAECFHCSSVEEFETMDDVEVFPDGVTVEGTSTSCMGFDHIHTEGFCTDQPFTSELKQGFFVQFYRDMWRGFHRCVVWTNLCRKPENIDQLIWAFRETAEHFMREGKKLLASGKTEFEIEDILQAKLDGMKDQFVNMLD